MKLYNTLSGGKLDFTVTNGTVKMYVCGPNLYGPCHMGHALSFVVFDVLRRYLEYLGHKVIHVQNFTDIEDRIIQVAQEQNCTTVDLADHYIQRFLEEMDSLGIQRAHHYPKATESIDRMLEIVQNLIDKNHAYTANGDVYFRVRSFPKYGRLSKRSIDDMEAGARIEINPDKEDPMDFVLWKASKKGEPSWPSPWGLGRPGWHIECTAMSTGQLGEQLDIHGGGQDVVFPHHENEIAQSEAYTNSDPFVRFWVHNGLLRLVEDDKEKMTRHQGNFVSCRDALARYHPDTIRLFLLSSHYRSPRVYSEEEMLAHERASDRMRAATKKIATSQETESLPINEYRRRFMEAMDDDLNTPRAIAVLFDMTRNINKNNLECGPAQELLRELGGILGLTFDDLNPTDSITANPFIELLIQVRTKLRDAKEFQLADSIRDSLSEIGVSLEDGPQGTGWHFRKTH